MSAIFRSSTKIFRSVRPIAKSNAFISTPMRFYAANIPKTDIESRVLGIVRAFDKVKDPSNITASSTFANDLGLDSLDTVEVVMAIEEEFSVEIPDNEADEIKSVGQAIEYISKHSEAR